MVLSREILVGHMYLRVINTDVVMNARVWMRSSCRGIEDKTRIQWMTNSKEDIKTHTNTHTHIEE